MSTYDNAVGAAKTATNALYETGDLATATGGQHAAINLLATAATGFASHPILNSHENGLIIPWYFYPNNPYSDSTCQNFLGLIRQYHKVPVMVIINSASGPGVWDGNWAAFITLLHGAGAIVLGYVDTADAMRSPSNVLADINGWATIYSATPVDGIFFDEMPYDPGVNNANVLLYAQYYNQAYAAGFSPVVANPGSDQQGVWYGTPTTADIICTWENSSYPPEATLQGNFVGGHSNFSWKRNAALVYNQATYDGTNFPMMMKYCRWLFVNSFNLPNPWAGLPSYLNTMLGAC
jgi:hypothetical protein